MEITIETVKFKLIQGDITKEKTDVIVNAANPTLRGGGGVDGAIHKAGGPTILKECVEKYPDGCNTGEARITTAGLMNAKWVIHTPGPIWRGGYQEEENLLKNSYLNCIMLANEYGAKSIAFPSISTGVYGFPVEKASKIAIQAVIKAVKGTSIEKIHFVLFSSSDYNIYVEALKEVSNIRD